MFSIEPVEGIDRLRVKWSQNFLADKNSAQISIDALSIHPDDIILEIGPGLGVLTKTLLEKSKKVVAVEIDPGLCASLKKNIGFHSHFSLIESDFLDSLITEELIARSGNFKIIGNLPYAVVSPILQKIFGWKNWTAAVFMVQKEVGERILAKEGGRAYGILSVSVQSRSVPEKIGLVSRFSFRPVPKVESMILRFKPLDRPLFQTSLEEQNFFRLVRACFAHRRKTILNSLSYTFDCSLEAMKAVLEKCGVSPQSRAEQISIQDFIRVSREFFEKLK